MSITVSNAFSLKNSSGVVQVTSPVITAQLVAQVLTCVKTQSKTSLVLNDLQDYTCTINNSGATPILGMSFYDLLDPHLAYVSASFKVNGSPETPVYNTSTRELLFGMPAIVPGVATVITFQVRVTSNVA